MDDHEPPGSYLADTDRLSKWRSQGHQKTRLRCAFWGVNTSYLGGQNGWPPKNGRLKTWPKCQGDSLRHVKEWPTWWGHSLRSTPMVVFNATSLPSISTVFLPALDLQCDLPFSQRNLPHQNSSSSAAQKQGLKDGAFSPFWMVLIWAATTDNTCQITSAAMDRGAGIWRPFSGLNVDAVELIKAAPKSCTSWGCRLPLHDEIMTSLLQVQDLPIHLRIYPSSPIRWLGNSAPTWFPIS